MRVPDEIRKCVCFVCAADSDGNMIPQGTAFFIGLPRSGVDGFWVYLVTAKHVLYGIQSTRPDGQFSLRVNRVSGDAGFAPTRVDDWFTHPDPTLIDDVAVLPWAPDPQEVDYKFFPVEQVAAEEAMTALDIGVGDEVCLPGLFVHHVGQDRNVPIVRVGNIAAMTEQAVRTKIGTLEAYLVEARSIGGLSGSPVFVNAGPARTTPTGNFTLSPPSFHLLGLMHGHFEVPVKQVVPELAWTSEAINMGIAIVPPASRIFDVLNGPTLSERRAADDQADSGGE